ncbi:MAG: T9SS type A sorting domain-containing protein [Bacteroidales bacterium]|nr:T9SS type A sorting domain-containing protein [Bacteroidales bacterium]
MKRIFTLMLVFAVTFAFAHRGEVSLDSKSDVSFSAKDDHGDVLMPGNWADATQVGTYRWVDSEQNPLGWIYGNNTYGDKAAAMPFEIDEDLHILGAYVWFGAVASGSGDVHFRVMEYNGEIGAEIGSVSIALNDIDEFATGEGITPDMYEDAFYVEFASPIAVSGDFAFVVDYGDLAWNAHGDGVGLSSTVGSGAGIAMIKGSDDVWVKATDVNPALIFDLGMFPHVEPADDNGDPDDTFMVTFNVDMTGAVASSGLEFDPELHRVFMAGNFPDAEWNEPGSNEDLELHMVTAKTKTAVEVYYEDFDGGLPDGWENIVISGPDGFPGWEWTTTGAAYGGTLESTTAGNGYMKLDSDAHGAPGSPEEADLITPSIDLSNAVSDVMLSVEHMARTYGAAEIRIYISTDDFESQTMIYEWQGGEQHSYNTDDGERPDPAVVVDEFDITDLAAGHDNVKIKFNWIGDWDYWWLIDDVRIMAVVEDDNGEPGEEWHYTLTLELPAGDYMYKYFIVADDPSWANGEWDGDPNREISVDEDKVVDDVWGEYGDDTSVPEVIEEHMLAIYPNPAASLLNIQSNLDVIDVTVYDITGRSLIRMNNTNVVDVSNLPNGMYIIQVRTLEGVQALRFHVAR